MPAGTGEIVRLSPDGSKLGIYSGRGLEVYDLTAPKWRKIGGPVAYAGGSVFPFAFTHDSKQVVSGDGYGHVRFWDVSGDAMRELAPAFDAGATFVRTDRGRVRTQLASAAGHLLLRRYDDALEVWGVAGSRFAPLAGEDARWPCRAVGGHRAHGVTSVTDDALSPLLKLRALRAGA